MMAAADPNKPCSSDSGEYRDLPSIDRLLRSAASVPLIARYGRALVTDSARALLQELRSEVRAQRLQSSTLTIDSIFVQLEQRLVQQMQPRMKRVFNLTGTVIHTNLGRALLADSALQQLVTLMASPNNLEYDLTTGQRGDRDEVVEDLLCRLTGAQAATVVNNNAAAVLLTIAALARGREVIVSRGELVEIGGAFRMPDVMTSAGARLVEIGTTNRTHAADYEQAIGPNTALIMKVHTSNYAIRGFTASVDEKELATIARRHDIPLATDLGSGSLIDLEAYGLPREPLPQEKIAAGCHAVSFSGDKLLGGPQAGVIVGERDIIERIRRFPMKRALRISKLPLAALEATLRLYLNPEKLCQTLPTLRLLTRPLDLIRATAWRLATAITPCVQARFSVEVCNCLGQIGSGSLPIERLPSVAVSISPTERKGAGTSLDELATALRSLPTPVIGRISEQKLLLDCRCLEDESQLIEQLPALAGMLGSNDRPTGSIRL
jgi:L-seryl-tRNA(Ser) seleniumtransferase